MRSGYIPSRSSNPYSGMYNENTSGGSSDFIQTYLNILGPSLTTFLLSKDYTNPDELQRRLRIYSLILLVSSIFFWFWAIYNTWYLRTTNGAGMDLGIFSFLGTIISSAWLLHASLGGKWYDEEQRLGCFGKLKKKGDNDDFLFGGNARRGKDADAASKHCPPGKCLRIYVIMTQVVVVANYLLGLLFALTAGRRVYVYFATYCFTFSLLWISVAFAGWVIVEFYRNAVSFSYGKDQMDSGRDCGGLLWKNINSLRDYVFGAPDYYDDGGYSDDGFEDDDEEEIDDELKALFKGSGYS